MCFNCANCFILRAELGEEYVLDVTKENFPQLYANVGGLVIQRDALLTKLFIFFFEQLFPVEDKIGQRELQRDSRACSLFHGGEKDIKNNEMPSLMLIRNNPECTDVEGFLE